jgi:hypothetical protein
MSDRHKGSGGHLLRMSQFEQKKEALEWAPLWYSRARA